MSDGDGLPPEQISLLVEEFAALFPPTATIKISTASLRQRFISCEPDYIRENCQGRCCRGSCGLHGPTLLREEVAVMQRLGAEVDGFFIRSQVACPFQQEDGLCSLHGTGAKPFGCISSPLVLTASDTLVIRNRYRRLKCYTSGGTAPAHEVFRSGLELLLGSAELVREVCARADAGEPNFHVRIPLNTYVKKKHIDALWKGTRDAR